MSIWCLLRESLQDPPAFFREQKPSLAPCFALFGPHCPRDPGFKKNAKRFCWALEMPGRGRYALKIGISAFFGPKAWGPPTPGRKRLPGLIRRSAERARLGRPAGTRFSGSPQLRKPARPLFRESLRGSLVFTRAVPFPFGGVPERFLVSCQRLASPDEGVRKGFLGDTECRSGVS